MKKFEINFSENVDFNANTNKSNNANINEADKFIYKCIFHCPINKLECVNSMDIYDDILLYGTIMGNVTLCHIDENNLCPKMPINKKDNCIQHTHNTDKKDSTIDKLIIEKKRLDKDPNKISLKKIKENLYSNNNNVNSHNNLTYSNINNINNEEGEEEEISEEKYSNKANDINETSMNQKKIKTSFIKNENEEINIIKNNFESEDIPLIPYPQITKIISSSGENIPCIIFETKDKALISIGDYELYKLDGISKFNSNDPNSSFTHNKIENYDSKSYHYLNCENSMCFLTPENFLLLNMTIGDINTPEIKQENINYTNTNIKNFTKPEIKKGIIEANNFTVPFDFDGSYLLYIEYISENKRKICIFDTLKEELFFEYLININDDIGHISFMRFLPGNKIFLVRNNNICEIRQINDKFSPIETWEHFGEEVVSIQIYLEGSKLSSVFAKDNFIIKNESDNLSFNSNEKEDEKVVKIRINNINLYNSSLREIKKRNKHNIFDGNWDLNDINIVNNYTNKNNFDEMLGVNVYKNNNNKNISKNNEHSLYSFATLDINGNFNIHKNNQTVVLFNLYDIEGIEQKYKEQEFFDLKFPYYISMNLKYICISTDHGIFVITKMKK